MMSHNLFKVLTQPAVTIISSTSSRPAVSVTGVIALQYIAPCSVGLCDGSRTTVVFCSTVAVVTAIILSDCDDCLVLLVTSV